MQIIFLDRGVHPYTLVSKRIESVQKEKKKSPEWGNQLRRSSIYLNDYRLSSTSFERISLDKEILKEQSYIANL